MIRSWTLAAVGVLIMGLPSGGAQAAGDQAAGLQARHHEGQTFLTWKEIEATGIPAQLTNDEFKKVAAALEAKKLRYRIYRSKTPITVIKGLTPIAEVGPLRAWNSGFYGMYPPATAQVPRYVITEGQSPLAPGTGLFVYNPPEAGAAYYAVSAVVNGQENTAIAGDNVLSGAVKETVGPGVPVLQRTPQSTTFHYVDGALLHYYTRWESAPNSNANGWAFDYLVAVPSGVGKHAQVGLHLHAWGGYEEDGYGWWFNGSKGSILVASTQSPYDWWTGYHEFLWTSKPLQAPQDWQKGVVHPYTQRRLLSFLDWVGTKWDIDKNRTFVAGSSMGGSGSLMLAIRYPQQIAWAVSWVGVHIPSESPSFKGSYAAVYGEPQWGAKFEDGTPVWDYFNDEWYLRRHPEAEIGFLTFSNGKNDGSIGWGQAVKFLRALQDTKRPHLFVWGQDGHGQRAVMPAGGGENVMPLDLRINQSVPAFTKSSLDSKFGNGDPGDGDPVGQVNAHLVWETDGIVDESDQWSMVVGVGGNAPTDQATVDVTPRRCQNFHPKPGDKFRWTNSSTGLMKKVVQSGEVVADKWGIVTLERVTISKGKNKLTITK